MIAKHLALLVDLTTSQPVQNVKTVYTHIKKNVFKTVQIWAITLTEIVESVKNALKAVWNAQVKMHATNVTQKMVITKLRINMLVIKILARSLA